MKRITEIAKVEQPEKNLELLLPLPKLSSNEISIYRGPLTTKTIIEGITVIQKSFPDLPIGFYEIFKERIKANGFSNERLKDAITYVIDNCIYPTPTIAQFLTWDRRIEVFTYEQMLKKWDDGAGDSYEPIQFPDREKPVWVHVNDIKMYNLK